MATRSPPPAATIIVVTYNSRRFLPRQMAALAAQTAPFDLIVYDNASDLRERPQEADLAPGARLVQAEENTGFAGGANRAAKLAETEHIIFLNPDAFPEPDWLAELCAAAARWPNAAAIGSTQVSDSDPGMLDGAGDGYAAWGVPYRALFAKRVAAPAEESECFSACAAAALYRRDLFEALGGFDERFFCYGEDVDLGFRARLVGHVHVQAPRAIVRHVGGGSSSGSAFADEHGVRNRYWTFCKNMPSPLFALMWLPHMATALLNIAMHAFDGRWRAQARGLATGLLGAGPALAARRDIQAQRNARLGALCAAFTWSPWALATRAPKRRRHGADATGGYGSARVSPRSGV